MKPIYWYAGAAGLLGAAAWCNYRRFAYQPRALGETSFPVEARELRIPMEDRTIYGRLLLPRGHSGRLPTVICSHGLGSSGKAAEGLVGTSLAMSGFAVYCFDFFGGNPRSKSGGAMWEMSVFTEQADLNAVIDAIQALDTTDTDNLFLLGESQGGFVTAITAAQRPQDIRAVIEYYPAFCIPDDARARHKDAIPERETLGRSVLGRVYSENLMDYDVYSILPRYTGPVLILHGDHDRTVDISYGRRAADAYKHAEFVCLPGEIHGFTGRGKEKAAELSYEFLNRVMENDDREEILTIYAKLGKAAMKHEGLDNIMTVPFSGEADSRWFRGAIEPGAVDVQRRRLWKTVRFCADYTLDGTDYTGAKCHIHIINMNEGQGWKPAVHTDSEALSFLNRGNCRAVLQGHKDQLVVRVFARSKN